MKNLKPLFIVFALTLSAVSFVAAQNCVEIVPGFGLCGQGETCVSAACSCPSMGTIASGTVCTTTSPVTCLLGSSVLALGDTGSVYQSGNVDYGVSCIDETVTCIDGGGGTGILVGSSFTASSCIEGAAANCTFGVDTVLHGNSITAYLSGLVPFGGSCTSESRFCTNGILDGTYIYDSCDVDTAGPGSCTLPRGVSIASGDSETGYQNSSVACGSSCVSALLTCNSGALDTTGYDYASCSVAGCGGGGGGGGSSTPTCELEDLICVDGIYEEVEGVNCRYGELGDDCDMPSTGNAGGDYNFTRIGDISNSPYSAELNLAYLYAYNMGITDMANIFDANMEGNLIRSHMAKMLVERATNVMGLEANTEITCSFDDIASLQGQDLYDFVIEACQMGLMGLDNEGNPVDSFNPDQLVTRAQFGTVLSRAIWGDYYNGANPYYVDHLNVLNAVSIMNNISDPYMFELRGYVMLMLFRADSIID